MLGEELVHALRFGRGAATFGEEGFKAFRHDWRGSRRAWFRNRPFIFYNGRSGGNLRRKGGNRRVGGGGIVFFSGVTKPEPNCSDQYDGPRNPYSRPRFKNAPGAINRSMRLLARMLRGGYVRRRGWSRRCLRVLYTFRFLYGPRDVRNEGRKSGEVQHSVNERV